MLRREAAARRYDLALLCAPDTPWVEDWQRVDGHRREEMHERFRAELERAGRRYVVVRGGWEERFEIARRAVEEVIGE